MDGVALKSILDRIERLEKMVQDISERIDGIQQQITDLEDSWIESIRNAEYYRDDEI